MTINKLIFKVLKKLKYIISYALFQYPSILKYKFLSNCENIIGKPIYNQPVLMLGKGKISFGESVTLGYYSSPYFYSGYVYLDVRKKESFISFGKNVYVNNNCTFISDGAGIVIEDNVLIGSNVEIIDSDFHDINPTTRFGGIAKTAKVHIENNVFIGANVRILKGVHIGENSVIANSSIVVASVPSNVIIGGNPARVISQI